MNTKIALIVFLFSLLNVRGAEVHGIVIEGNAQVVSVQDDLSEKIEAKDDKLEKRCSTTKEEFNSEVQNSKEKVRIHYGDKKRMTHFLDQYPIQNIKSETLIMNNRAVNTHDVNVKSLKLCDDEPVDLFNWDVIQGYHYSIFYKTIREFLKSSIRPPPISIS